MSANRRGRPDNTLHPPPLHSEARQEIPGEKCINMINPCAGPGHFIGGRSQLNLQSWAYKIRGCQKSGSVSNLIGFTVLIKVPVGNCRSTVKTHVSNHFSELASRVWTCPLISRHVNMAQRYMRSKSRSAARIHAPTIIGPEQGYFDSTDV